MTAVWWRRPEPQVPFNRIEVVNPSDGGFFHWLIKFYVFGALCGLGLLFLAGHRHVRLLLARLPALPDIDRYEHEAAESTVLRAWDGTILADWATKRREILPAKDVPPLLMQAFVAIEDRRFYEHGGLDYRGIVRAVLANLRAGEVSQGGSTITQQVARVVLRHAICSSRAAFLRKIPEAILARRLEARYTKDEILTLYLNQIFLGQTAYGVAAAARRYFDKTVDELDLGEMATIAGIARAPSRFSPIRQPGAGAEPPRPGAGGDGRRRLHQRRGRGRRLQGQAAGAAPAARLLPRALALLRRARAPRHRPALRRQDAVRGRAGDRDHRRALDRPRPRRRTSTSRCASWTSARAGAGRWPACAGAAAEQFRAQMAERYGNEPARGGPALPGPGRVQRARRAPRCGWARSVYDLPSAHMNWAFPFSIKDSTNGKHLDTTSDVLRAGRRDLGVQRPPEQPARASPTGPTTARTRSSWLQAYKDKAPPGQVRR